MRDQNKAVIVREVLPEEKKQFNAIVTHPLQAWEWGEFRIATGKKVIRLGVFDPSTDSAGSPQASSEQAKLKAGFQLTVHLLPQIPYTILYFPKGPMPDKTMLNALKKLGNQEKAILVKLEPNVGGSINQSIKTSKHQSIKEFLQKNGCRSGQPLFTKYTFQLDLAQTEDQLLTAMKPKTRYNIRISQRHGVEVVEDNSQRAFETYLKLMLETTKRQKFYAHTPDYHRKMWQNLNPAGIAHLLLAKYKGKILVAWILFAFNKILYYPYGASTREHHETMPSYAMMWEAIRFGQKMGCKTFDLWGTPGPNPDPQDPWYGFHRFKQGFGAQLVEFIGTWDLVINPQFYPLYNLANEIRWKFLKLKTLLP